MRGGERRCSPCTGVGRTVHDTWDMCTTFSSNDRGTGYETNGDRAESEMSPVPWSRDTRDMSLLCAAYMWFHRRRRSGDIEPRVGSSLGTSAYDKSIFSFTVIPSVAENEGPSLGVRAT
jgi:hypothetical protein